MTPPPRLTTLYLTLQSLPRLAVAAQGSHTNVNARATKAKQGSYATMSPWRTPDQVPLRPNKIKPPFVAPKSTTPEPLSQERSDVLIRSEYARTPHTTADHGANLQVRPIPTSWSTRVPNFDLISAFRSAAGAAQEKRGFLH